MIQELKDYEEYLNLKQKIDSISWSDIKEKYYLNNKFSIENLNNLLIIVHLYVHENSRAIESIMSNLVTLLQINFQFKKIIYTDNNITIRRGRMYKFRGKTTLPMSSILDLKFKHTNEIEEFILSYVDRLNLEFPNARQILDTNYRSDFLNNLHNQYDRTRDEIRIFDNPTNVYTSKLLTLVFDKINSINDLYLYNSFTLSKLKKIKIDLISAIVKLKEESSKLYSIDSELKERKSKYDLINGL
jgi:hypothetical protein